MKEKLMLIYKTIRSFAISIIGIVSALYLLLYILLTIPFVQNKIKTISETELSKLLNTEVRIGELSIYPFNEVVLYDVSIPTQEGSQLLQIQKLGAGISIYRLLIDQRIVFTYGEIIGLKANLKKANEEADYNFQFIIDALSSKDKNKKPSAFDIKIYNFVIRKSYIQYDLENAEEKPAGVFDKNHISIENLRADILVPKLKNNDFEIRIKRISFEEKSGFNLKRLSTDCVVNDKLLCLKKTNIELAQSILKNDSIGVKIKSLATLKDDIKNSKVDVLFDNVKLVLSDFTCFVPALKNFSNELNVYAKVQGDIKHLDLSEIKIDDERKSLSFLLRGEINDVTDKENLSFNVAELNAKAKSNEIIHIVQNLPNVKPNVKNILEKLGDIDLQLVANGTKKSVSTKGCLSTDLGEIKLQAIAEIKQSVKGINANISTETFQLGKLLSTNDIGDLAVNITADAVFDKTLRKASVKGQIPFITAKGYKYDDVEIELFADNGNYEGEIALNDDNCQVIISGDAKIAKEDKKLNLHVDAKDVDLYAMNLLKKQENRKLSFEFDASLQGENYNELNGNAKFSNLSFVNVENLGLHIKEFMVDLVSKEMPQRIIVKSDILNGEVFGKYDFKTIPTTAQNMISKVIPSIVKPKNSVVGEIKNDFKFSFVFEPTQELNDVINTPVKFIYRTTLDGFFNEQTNSFNITLNAPYLQQGKKLIEDTKLTATLDGETNKLDVNASTLFPLKSGKATTKISVTGLNDIIEADLGWKLNVEKNFSGNLNFTTKLNRNELQDINADIIINPTTIAFNDTTWNIYPSTVEIRKDEFIFNNLRGENDKQYVNIDGKISKNPLDRVCLDLNHVSLDYVFETLEIENVTFGGVATGKFYASEVLTKVPKLFTPNLHVDRMSYNGGLLGDADIKSNWDMDTKGISLYADIKQKNGHNSVVDGILYPIGDSLNLKFDVDKIDVKFLQPFLKAFSSNLSGTATGNARLFGTFHDVDLEGKIFGEDLAIKIDYINATYKATDTVTIKPGELQFNNITFYDRNGNTAKLSGWVKHDFFRNATFDFALTEAKEFLCYDINEKMNDKWYGTIYGNGAAFITGDSEIVKIGVNMETTANSKFTFVLSNSQAATEYNFITFVDRNKKDIVEDSATINLPEMVKSLIKKDKTNAEISSSSVQIDLNADITDEAQLTLVMDPISGDKIRANGNGNMRMTYDSSDDAMAMYGKYILEKGTYNFTLQDIIIKEFKIRQGSSISFQGDPFSANLDINAIYSLNANLQDLDETFASDRDLNRTSVPVYAVLNLKGGLDQPDISFDLEFPTLTSDAYRKVKSVISTEDMMNRQIIYLLALNRFYTPEYMSANSHANQMTSVASSTISSQLSNILGQMSENWSISPNFRSNKGDFSDMEVDVALSSQLLNNRLLFNGNFGYRDKSLNNLNSSFIGDFDLEYLINRRGTIRLKAYNHFNDQNYYVRNAKTTQGVGVVLKFDFNNPFKKNRKKENQKEK